MICNACGATDAPSQCSRCLSVAYCDRNCQRNDWSSHKRVCRQPSVQDSENSQDLAHPCPICETNPDDLGAAAMCVSCADYIMCGPCTTLASTGAENGFPSITIHICDSCQANYDAKQETPTVGLCLKKLLKEKPVGRHVNYAKLMLAQVRLHDKEDLTGVPPSRRKAKQEYIRLADEENYGLAQFALATFFDPTDSQAWDGPLNLVGVGEVIDEQSFPFSYNARLARKYYDKAVGNKCTMALQTVGTMYKNGQIYPCNKVKAAQLLREATEVGDARAMCNLGQMLMQGDGIRRNFTEGMDLYLKAALEHDIWSAQLMVAQIGMADPTYSDEGNRMIRKLVAEDWVPPNARLEQVYELARSFYEVDDDDE